MQIGSGKRRGGRRPFSDRRRRVVVPTKGDLEIKRLVVAVHGIGSQFRYATVQSVASRFMAHCGLQMTLPLGAFHPAQLITNPDSPELGAYLFKPPKDFKGDFSGFGFAEAFWADIPERAAATNNTTEESKAWAQTIVDRVRDIDESSAVKAPNLIDYRKAGAVVEEMIDSIKVLENLLFLAEKAGLFEFKLGQLLTDFLGDVQIVTEFKDYGGDVSKRFATTMGNLTNRLRNVDEIYLVAHSEGTVVAFRGLLIALAARKDESNKWVDKVKGFMTIGSPLNKHIVLWPDFWQNLRPDQTRVPRTPILWRNYYDLGDPVGFDLEITREWLAQNEWVATNAPQSQNQYFSFGQDDDCGFTRYPFPGKAHNDYWQDDVVFGHFIEEVVVGKGLRRAAKPKTFWWASFLSNVVPYFLCLGLVWTGAYLLYKTSVSVLELDGHHRFWKTAGDVSGIACLVAGITVLGRMPRLEKTPASVIIGFSAFGAGAVAYRLLAAHHTREHLGSIFGCSTWGLIVAGLLVGGISALSSRSMPRLGMLPLIGLGGIVALLILCKLYPTGSEPSLWPLILANAAFLYLWWLSALIFDLVYIWHQFVRSRRTTETLKSLRENAAIEMRA